MIKEKSKNNKGITLIAVVVIILGILILSAIIITTLQADGEKVVKPENTNNSTNNNINIAKHSHNYTNFVETVEKANCTSRAKNKYECSCGATTIKEEGTILSHTWGNGVVRTEPTSTEEGVREFECLNCGATKTEIIPKTESIYLVDTVEIGDYIDIGINYINQATVNTEYLNESNTDMTGWRVLSKKGSGSTGTVKLVSAGVPLLFNHISIENSEDSINSISELNKNIQIVSTGQQGFTKNGFNNNDLMSIWTSCNQINTTVGVHAMTVNEAVQAYYDITGDKKTISELEVSKTQFITNNLISVNSNISEKSYNLLGNGLYYWLGGTGSTYYNNLYCVTDICGISSAYTSEFGVRPVVTLNAGVEVSNINSENGLSSETAYKLK